MKRALAAIALAVATASPAGAQNPEASFVTVDVVPTPTSAMLFGVTFADPNHGYAVGAYGTILATTDGGRTWFRQVSGVEKEETGDGEANVLHDASFVDTLRGWVVGDNGIILATEDGGQRWVRREPPPIASIPGEGPGTMGVPDRLKEWDFRAVHFSDPLSGHVAGTGGTFLTTSDGGKSWFWHGDRRYGLVRDVSFPDRQHGQAVADSPSARDVFATLATADGGTSWQPRDAKHLGETVQTVNFSSVAFADAQRGWVGGFGGRILATTDGGRRWVVQRRDTTETFEGMAFADARRGVAVGHTDFSDGPKASLASTADGGETWVSRLVPGVILWGVAFATPTTAFGVGCEVHPTVGPRPEPGGCQKSLIARITFAAPSGAGDGGGTALSIPLAVGIAAAAVLAIVAGLRFRRRTG